MTIQSEFDFGENDSYQDITLWGTDTVTLLTNTSPLATVDLNNLANSGFYTISPSSSSGWNLNNGVYTTTISNSGTGPLLSSVPSTSWPSGNSNPGLHVKDDATFEGDIKWKGRSLGKLLEKIEDRLAILQEPDPERLKRFAALREAYDAYKLLDTLCGDDKKENK